MVYQSPSQGRLEFGWKGPLSRSGTTVELHDYPRYQNPFLHAGFPAERVSISHNDQRLMLDWQTLQRATTNEKRTGEPTHAPGP